MRTKGVATGILGLGVALLVAGCPTRTQWLIARSDGGGADAAGSADAGPTCSGSLVSCEGECVDLSSNADHCGDCENECAAGETCVSDNCQCAPSTEVCGETCRDTTADPLHCGGCDLPCEAEERCVAGNCVCRPGLQRCGEECVDTSTDPSHCGDCTTDCTGTGTPYCYAGGCSAVACEAQMPAMTTCGSDELSCVAPAQMQSSALHCGECEQSCDADELCTGGECQSYYPAAGCTSCPCADVCGTNLCCTLPGAAVLICLVGATSCPG